MFNNFKNTYFLLLVLLSTCQFSFAQDWEQVASVPDDFRTDHTFGFGIDNIGYLVAGGDFNNNFTSSFYSYDPDGNIWTKKDDFPGAARGFAIGDIYEGKAYFGFGANEYFDRLDDLWVYDPLTDDWSQLANCECLGRTHPAMAIVDNKIYVGLGGSEQGNMNDWWEYDINSNVWTQRTNFPGAPRHHPFQFTANGFIYVGFGHGSGFISNEWYRYDHFNDTWEQVATLPAEGRVAGTQFSHEEKGYILSGDGDDHQSMETGEFWEYDPILDTWEAMPSHPGLSRWAPASFVVNNEIYLINGYSTGIGYPESVWKYNLNQGMVATNDENFVSINAFPNPTTNTLTIKSSNGKINADASVNIYSLSGLLIETQSFGLGNIDLINLNKGVYILEVPVANFRKRITKI